MQVTNDNPAKLKRKSIFSAGLAVVFFCCCFIVIPLGNFFIWLAIGATLYFTFLSIYYMVLYSKHKSPIVKRKPSAQEQELKAYINHHIPIVISVLLGGLLLAIIIVFFVT